MKNTIMLTVAKTYRERLVRGEAADVAGKISDSPIGKADTQLAMASTITTRDVRSMLNRMSGCSLPIRRFYGKALRVSRITQSSSGGIGDLIYRHVSISS